MSGRNHPHPSGNPVLLLMHSSWLRCQLILIPVHIRNKWEKRPVLSSDDGCRWTKRSVPYIHFLPVPALVCIRRKRRYASAARYIPGPGTQSAHQDVWPVLLSSWARCQADWRWHRIRWSFLLECQNISRFFPDHCHENVLFLLFSVPCLYS